MNKFLSIFTEPRIDAAFKDMDYEESIFMAMALLRRHPIISEVDGEYIAYHYKRDAAAEVIINGLYRAFKQCSQDDLGVNHRVTDIYNRADEWVYKYILSEGPHQRIIAADTKIDLETLPLLTIPGFTILDGIIMPETQQEWAVKKTFEHVNLDTQIIDAIYHDQNVIFIVGKSDGDPVLIGDVLQNEVINIIFADTNFNILSGNTYRLS